VGALSRGDSGAGGRTGLAVRRPGNTQAQYADDALRLKAQVHAILELGGDGPREQAGPEARRRVRLPLPVYCRFGVAWICQTT